VSACRPVITSSRPSLPLSDGRFVVTWQSSDGSQTDIYGRVYDANGTVPDVD
jgi:hypothetical protein